MTVCVYSKMYSIIVYSFSITYAMSCDYDVIDKIILLFYACATTTQNILVNKSVTAKSKIVYNLVVYCSLLNYLAVPSPLYTYSGVFFRSIEPPVSSKPFLVGTS